MDKYLPSESKLSLTSIDTFVEAARYGGKAHWLSWLHSKGYLVPFALFLPALRSRELPEYLDRLAEPEFLRGVERFREGATFEVAVRSSATIEDSYEQSYAGHFKTLSGSFTLDGLRTAVREVYESAQKVPGAEGSRMGVVIQQYITPQWAGVVFSTSPLSQSKEEVLISVVSGSGDSLVSGREAGEDIVAVVDKSGISLSSHSGSLADRYLEELCEIAKDIETEVDAPVDIEWAVDKRSGALYLVQCRPVARILLDAPQVIRVTRENEAQIPTWARSSDKVSLRLIAEDHGIKMSRATIVMVPCGTRQRPAAIPPVDEIASSKTCSSYSAVLIQPRRLSGKVIRAFLGSSKSLSYSTRACVRYTVRSYPDYSSIEECLRAFADLCTEQYWNVGVILQEIPDFKFAGVIQHGPDGFLIEVARGHFIPKGVVRTSQYLFTDDGQCIYRNETNQEAQYAIRSGQVIEETIPFPESLTSVHSSSLIRMITEFRPLLISPGAAIEFGLLEGEGELIPYAIDHVSEKGVAAPSLASLAEGVVSHGVVTGKLFHWHAPATEETSSLNAHFYDTPVRQRDAVEPTIVVSEKPDITLLQLVYQFAPGQLGFIFREASLLCHLAIVLRERGVPAVVIPSTQLLPPSGTLSHLDASTPGIVGAKRLSVIE